MSWIQLSIDTDSTQADDLSELLEQFGAVSVSLAAADDEALFAEPGQVTTLWDTIRMTALLPVDIDMDIVLMCIRNRIGDDHIFGHSISLLKDKDWVGGFQQEHQPILFSDRLCICPSWCDPPPGVTTIILDPGLAFGTGTHATTALCLRWLVDHDFQDKTLIDYGCGSGILAMTAASLGAEQVFAVDIDPQAIKSCSNNLRNNQLEGRVKVMLADQLKLSSADVLIANILLNPLMSLAGTFADLVSRPGGRLVLSGLLHVQLEACLAAYAPWFDFQEPVFEQEWALLAGVRRAS